MEADKESNRMAGGGVYAASTNRGRLAIQAVSMRLQNAGYMGITSAHKEGKYTRKDVRPLHKYKWCATHPTEQASESSTHCDRKPDYIYVADECSTSKRSVKSPRHDVNITRSGQAVHKPVMLGIDA